MLYAPKPVVEITAEELTASLKLTNNGYLFAPTWAESKCARLHPELFTVSANGTISPKGFVFERYPSPAPKPRRVQDDFDYEGAILARQAKFYD